MVDPGLPSQATRPIWLPRVNLRLAVLTSLPPDLFGGRAFEAALRSSQRAAEGLYADIDVITPAIETLVLRGELDGGIAIVITLDALFDDRLDTARRLHRMLTGGRPASADFSAYRRVRLKLTLRALDGRLAGAGYREVAKVLFPLLLGRDLQPGEALIGRAIRLVRYGVRLMNGGYLDLLRPERRAPKRRRKRP